MAAKFDASALTPDAADETAFKSESTKNNPAVQWLRDSYESDAARQVKVPANQVRRSEEHTSELQSLMRISYAVFCLKKKNKKPKTTNKTTYRKQLNTKTQ